MNANQQPKVSILIPNKDRRDLLEPCIDSILNQTTYKNYEIVIIENNSTDTDTLKYYDELKNRQKVRIVNYPDKEFNYQKIMNYGVDSTDAEYILQLNNDTELLTPNWLELMQAAAKRDDIGAVGTVLYYSDMKVQHFGGYAYMLDDNEIVYDHLLRQVPKSALDNMTNISHTYEVSWVTGACMMISKSLYIQAGGMDEGYKQNYGDIDLCMKVRALGKHNVVHAGVQLMHFEGATRGSKVPEDCAYEADYFLGKWIDYIAVKTCFPDTLLFSVNTENHRNKQLIAQLSGHLKNLEIRYDDMIKQRDIMRNQRDELNDLYDDMTKQRDNRDDQIAAIYESNAWKIGSKITGFLKKFKRS